MSEVKQLRDDAVIAVGAGGHGKSLVSVLQSAGFTVAAILDDDPRTWGKTILGVPVVGASSELEKRPGVRALLCVGDNAARKALAESHPETSWLTVVHPRAFVNPTVRLGPGTVVYPGAVIGADVVIGAHVIISANCTVGHDSRLEDYAQIAPGSQIAGGVSVASGALLGIGSVVLPGIRIGEWSTLGAGSTAVRNIPSRCTAFGVPAQPLLSR